MILADYLSRNGTKDIDPSELIPITFVTISEQLPEEIAMLNSDPEPVHIPDSVNPKAHTSRGVPTPTSRSLPPMSPIPNMALRKVLSSIPEGNERENTDEVELLRRKYRKALNPTPIEGIDVGDSEEVLDPQIRIPDQSDFELPTPLQDVVDPSKVTHKFLPKQREINRLMNQINRKVLRDT